jgi:hypothetical protein
VICAHFDIVKQKSIRDDEIRIDLDQKQTQVNIKHFSSKKQTHHEKGCQSINDEW